jgi:hypothetical protein
VTRGQRGALTWGLAAALAALIAAAVRPNDRDLILDVYLLFAGALALALLVSATRRGLPRGSRSRLERALEPLPTQIARPDDVASLERKLMLATETAFEVHYRLRPILREIAGHRLSTRRGIELDTEVEAARGVLGPTAWELVRSDREPPADRLGPGHPLADLRAVVDALERI